MGKLSDGFAGKIVYPDDPGYDEARAVSNSMIDRRPALIVRPTGTDDALRPSGSPVSRISSSRFGRRPLRLGPAARRVRLRAPMLSDRFRAAVEQRNVDHVPELFHEHAVFRSPVLFKPYEGRDQVLRVLRAAEQVLGIGDSFRYLHQLDDPADRVAILEFATEVDGKQVEGIDKLTFDEDGLITELKVMIRPASALQLVGARMAEEFPRVGLSLPS